MLEDDHNARKGVETGHRTRIQLRELEPQRLTLVSSLRSNCIFLEWFGALHLVGEEKYIVVFDLPRIHFIASCGHKHFKSDCSRYLSLTRNLVNGIALLSVSPRNLYSLSNKPSFRVGVLHQPYRPKI